MEGEHGVAIVQDRGLTAGGHRDRATGARAKALRSPTVTAEGTVEVSQLSHRASGHNELLKPNEPAHRLLSVITASRSESPARADPVGGGESVTVVDDAWVGHRSP